MNQTLTMPLTKEAAAGLTAGDYVTISGVIYTARDAAHKRMIETLEAGGELPIPMEGTVLTIWDLPRPETEDPSGLRDPQLRAGWTGMRQS